MAAMRAVARQAPAHEQQEPTRRSRLALVKAHRLPVRLQRRRARAMALLAAGFVVGALFLVTGAQALIASQQVRLDNLQSEYSSAAATNDNLELERAQLSAPGAVLTLAEHRLHMVVPGSVSYLTPLDPGPTVGEVSARGSR